eukprot:SAG11_NODE_517_length_8815_cov_35.866797_2_plen_83_part_00
MLASRFECRRRSSPLRCCLLGGEVAAAAAADSNVEAEVEPEPEGWLLAPVRILGGRLSESVYKLATSDLFMATARHRAAMVW